MRAISLEETGLKVKIESLLDVQSDLHLDSNSRLEYHYVLIDYLASPLGGNLKLNPESSASGWFTETRTKKLKMSEGTRSVLSIFFRQR
jgi:ADP-ribose pyrophosphatase YjhB (NUDIX family)